MIKGYVLKCEGTGDYIYMDTLEDILNYFDIDEAAENFTNPEEILEYVYKNEGPTCYKIETIRNITVNCYNSNAVVTDGKHTININYDGSYCAGYSVEEFRYYVFETIIDEFDNISTLNVHEAVDRIMVYAQAYCED